MGEQLIPNDLRTTGEIATTLGVTVKTIRRWIAKGKLPAFKLGGQFRVSLRDALACMERVRPACGVMPRTRAEVMAAEAEVDAVLRAVGVRR